MKPHYDEKRDRWWVDSRRGGQRHRFSFSTKGDAVRKIAQLTADRAGFGSVWLELEPRARAEICAVLSEMREEGVQLREVWEAFKRGDARVASASVTVEVALMETLTAKRVKNLRENYLRDLARSVRQFASGRMESLVSSFTEQDVERFVAEPESANTRATRRGRMLSFFSFCYRKKWTATNLCADLEKPKVDRQPPRVFTIAECRKLLAFVEEEQPHALAWFTLALFAGIRPEECDLVTWQAVDFDHGHVKLHASTHKTRREHTVELPPNAIAWLHRAKELNARLPFPKGTRRKVLHKVRDTLGLAAWPQDVLRHSFCSYGSVERGQMWTAKVADHSEAVLRRHYTNTVPRADAKEFFALMPADALP